MSRFLHEDYASLVPYTPGEQLNDRKYIKLNTNENPYPPAPGVRAVLDSFDEDRLKLYPVLTQEPLLAALAKEYDLKTENLFVANGSDDVIAWLIMAFTGRGGRLACPDITYSFYPVYAQLFGVTLHQIPLREDFRVAAEDYLSLDCNILIANPNAPTGLVLTIDEIEKIVVSNPDRLVVIDEAYVAFAKENVSCVSLVNKYDNLAVVHTMSKSYSLAGGRVGYCMASPAIIEDLNKIRFSFNPYSMNTLSLLIATAAVEDRDYHRLCTDKVVAARDYAIGALRKAGFTCTDSQSNFIFVKPPRGTAADYYRLLRERGILIRYFSAPRINEYMRISIGTQEQMQQVVAAMLTITEEL